MVAMPQEQLAYRAGDHAVRSTRRVAAGIILILLGFPVAAYYSIGALFVFGAVQQHDPSVSWRDVGLCLTWALFGAAVFLTGLVLLVRRPKLRK